MPIKIKRTSAIGSLSITPLIDVVFLLLIFFLVSSRFAEEERELDLNLPSVTEALPATLQPEELVVNIDKEGRYYINGAFRQIEQVEQILRLRSSQQSVDADRCDSRRPGNRLGTRRPRNQPLQKSRYQRIHRNHRRKLAKAISRDPQAVSRKRKAGKGKT